jgi:hypothetical protein
MYTPLPLGAARFFEDVAYLGKLKINDSSKEVLMVRIYGSIFLVIFSLCGIREVRADEMSVELVAVTPEPSGMRRLFNGKDLTGWVGDSRLWSVRDGVIHGETTEKNPTSGNTFLIYNGSGDTPEEFEDFELRLSFRCNATNNSGIQYRSEWLTERKNDWVLAGYQHEVRNEIDFPNVSSFIYDEKGKGKRLCYIGEKCIRNAKGEKEVTECLLTNPNSKNYLIWMVGMMSSSLLKEIHYATT